MMKRRQLVLRKLAVNLVSVMKYWTVKTNRPLQHRVVRLHLSIMRLKRTIVSQTKYWIVMMSLAAAKSALRFCTVMMRVAWKRVLILGLVQVPMHLLRCKKYCTAMMTMIIPILPTKMLPRFCTEAMRVKKNWNQRLLHPPAEFRYLIVTILFLRHQTNRLRYCIAMTIMTTMTTMMVVLMTPRRHRSQGAIRWQMTLSMRVNRHGLRYCIVMRMKRKANHRLSRPRLRGQTKHRLRIPSRRRHRVMTMYRTQSHLWPRHHPIFWWKPWRLMRLLMTSLSHLSLSP
mmetsp:Transcript_34372/g.101041  ORF Transcript_34372/g.101041 Transcript_34372/m.101041 type:complete len:286 (+) Transcript_34372:1473-2330(+)